MLCRSVASCRDPLVAKIAAAGPEVFVKLKVVVAVTPATEAVTISAPMVPLAVKVDEVATPFESVVSVSVFVEFEKVPLAPRCRSREDDKHAAHGVAPIVTVATSGAANGVLTRRALRCSARRRDRFRRRIEVRALQPVNNTNTSNARARKIALRTCCALILACS